MVKRRTFFLACLVAAICFVGLASMGSAKETYKIGWIGPLSGPASYMGDAGKKTVMIAVEQFNAAGGVNGTPLEVIAYDSENKPDTTVQVMNRLIKKDNVLAIVGPTTSAEGMAAVNIAEQTKTPTVMACLTTKIVTPVRKYVFKTPIAEADTIAKDFDYMKAKGLTRIAVVTSQDGYGDGGLEQIEALAPKKGIQIVLKEKVSPMDNDMTPVVTKVKNSTAQALVEWCHLRPAIILGRNIKQVGLTIPVFHSMGAVTDNFLKDMEGAAEGHLGATFKSMDVESLPDNDPQKPVALKYQRDFKARYKENANMYGVNAWDAVQLVLTALKKAGPNKDKIRDAIEKTQNHVGAGGVFNLSPTKHSPDAESSVVIYRVAGGKWRLEK
jgi:branched-chain amino acid transport system substrate-binding protein